MDNEAILAIVERVRTTLEAIEPEFPMYADTETGEWETTTDGNWCPGHWIGLLWLSTVHSGNDNSQFRRAAQAYTEAAGWNQLRGSLFAGMNYRYAGFRAADLSGDASLNGLGIRGAAHVRENFDESSGIVPVGSFGTSGLERHAATNGRTVAAVDALYTAIGPLWRAASVTGDARYLTIARCHADTHIHWFVRDDGAIWHKASFDLGSGDLTDQYNQLTQTADTCWARGLGWSIAGLVDAYNATLDQKYLAVLERHIEYYQRYTPEDNVPYAELGPKAPKIFRDTSGAALAAYGLVRLRGGNHSVVTLREYGQRILSSLVEEYLTIQGPLRGQLHSGCYNAVDDIATNHELIWSTYYLLVGLLARREYSSQIQPWNEPVE